jgi:hypothetical protein
LREAFKQVSLDDQ